MGSKTADKNSAQTNKQTDRQTNRHYENNGHMAVIQYHILMEYCICICREWMSGIWPSDNGSSHINKVTLRRPRLLLRVWDAWPFTSKQPRHVTSHLADSASYLTANGNNYWSRVNGSALRWEGNRRSGFASAKRHRICHISAYRLNGLRKGDEHPTYTPVSYIALYYFNVILSEAIHWK